MVENQLQFSVVRSQATTKAFQNCATSMKPTNHHSIFVLWCDVFYHVDLALDGVGERLCSFAVLQEGRAAITMLLSMSLNPFSETGATKTLAEVQQKVGRFSWKMCKRCFYQLAVVSLNGKRIVVWWWRRYCCRSHQTTTSAGPIHCHYRCCQHHHRCPWDHQHRLVGRGSVWADDRTDDRKGAAVSPHLHRKAIIVVMIMIINDPFWCCHYHWSRLQHCYSFNLPPGRFQVASFL